MRLSSTVITTQLFVWASNAYFTKAYVSISSHPSQQIGGTRTRSAFASPSSSCHTKSSLSMLESDFASAMPEKPKLSKQEEILQMATAFIVDIENRIAEGVEAVPELEALRQARDNNADEKELAQKVYELMIEAGMVYDQDPNTGSLTKTNFNIKNNLDIPEVKSEFAHLYNYGQSLCASGVLDIDTVKEIVMTRLIERTGLSPEEFDSWLGY